MPGTIDFWVEEALEALQVAEHLHEKGDYSYALFFGHLAIKTNCRELRKLFNGFGKWSSIRDNKEIPCPLV